MTEQRRGVTTRAAIFSFMHPYQMAHGQAPTQRMIAEKLGLSRGHVRDHMVLMCQWGLLERVGNQPGAFRVVEQKRDDHVD